MGQPGLQMHQILNRLSGGDSTVYRALCEVAFTTAMGPGALRRLSELAPAPGDVAKLIASSPVETAANITAICDKKKPLDPNRVVVRKKER